MNDIVNINGEPSDNENIEVISQQNEIIEKTEDMLQITREEILSKSWLSMPVAELSTIGAGAAALSPTLKAVSTGGEVLYKLANAGAGDALKIATDGTYWGAMNTAEGASKMAKFTKITETGAAAAATNPAIILGAIALVSVEQKLGNIEKLEKKIISYMEIEQEAEVEADAEMIINILREYKLNSDSAMFKSTRHMKAFDIVRESRKNILQYQKQIKEQLKSKRIISSQKTVESDQNDLIKKLKYYRMALFTYASASLTDLLLDGNFSEEYLAGKRDELEKYSLEYRETFGECSVYLDKLSKASIETNFLKGLGTASNAAGKFIGSIPKIRDGQVDEFLQGSGEKIKNSASRIENEKVSNFAELGNPETALFIEKINDLIKIYNHTEYVYVDEKNVYLLAG